MSSKKVKISEIKKISENYQTPIIINFQNGILNLENSDDTEFCTAFDTESNKKTALVAVNDNVYQGNIGEGYSTELVNTYIAIRNKRLKTIRFIQTDQVSMAHTLHKQDKKFNGNENNFSADFAAKKLVKTFGGRKACLYLERTQRMKVNLDIVKDQLNNTVENYDINSENANGSALTGLEEIVPPFNAQANNLSDIYNLNEIIPDTLLDRLDEEAKAVYSTQEELPIPSQFILKEILKLKNTFNSAENLTNIKVLLYMDGLLALIKTKNRNLLKTTLSNISEKIENDIRTRFSPKNALKSTKTSFSTDKAICYFITLLVLISPDYEIDINILMQELSKPRKKVNQYCNFVNLKTKSVRGNTMTLELPRLMKYIVGDQRLRKK